MTRTSQVVVIGVGRPARDATREIAALFAHAGTPR